MDKILVVMAAGFGSRYGGVKQIESIGPGGEILMEYAIYDAVAAGFNRLVVIVKPEIYDDVRELFGERIERGTGIRIDYAMQTNDRFTEGRPDLSGRGKPLGTVHAVLCAREYIDAPFCVVNADDYYGPEAFRNISAGLETLTGAGDSMMVAYRLKNTVSPYGTVTRGVCEVADGYLTKVTETYKIKLLPDGTIRDTSASEEGTLLLPDTFVSMNMWGCHPELLSVMEDYFRDFVVKLPENEQKAECLLPTMMDGLSRTGKTRIAVLNTNGHWFGLTYREDKPGVEAELSALHAEGLYPPTLWG